MIAPVVSYWWPSFPSDLWKEAFYMQLPQDQWALRVAHHAPWLVYWWNTQKWFPCSSAVAGRPNFTAPDLKIISSYDARVFNRVPFCLFSHFYYGVCSSSSFQPACACI